ncbi:conserved hypothetical protein [Flavobacterium sp. 9AF]|uniref:hypothetical protein n=1 Tax=Flavobacterium sp. 9AF TaxID=2653142 RepID=UPI0012EF4CA6|nr:hypothetical protein [Flavobacterium sp. 9AF]VXB26725.1 conserved hypothetical protein [Flavobacterium sp. 9AF]
MRDLIYLTIVCVILSCNSKQETIKGDLFFKLVNISSPSGMSSEEISKIEHMLKNVEENNNELIAYYKTLKNNNVLGNPYLLLKVNNDVQTIFLSKNEYEKIKLYTLDDLRKRNKTVEIELKIKKIDKDIFFSDEIISVKEGEGETPWQK